MKIIILRLKSIIWQLQTFSFMHPNNLFAPKLNDANTLNPSRTSSMFSKRPQFSDQKSIEFDKNRPISVNKIGPGSSENDLMKWLPLIKMTKKIQSKVKTLGMFFWCRLENLTQIKSSCPKLDKQNSMRLLNSPFESIQKTQNTNSISNPAIPHQVSNQEVINQPKATEIQEKTQPKFQNLQPHITENSKSFFEHKKESYSEIQVSNLVSLVQKTLEAAQRRIKTQGLQEITRDARKKLGLEKFAIIRLQQQKIKVLFTSLRRIKKHSHQVMKGEILGNTLKNCIRKTKISALQYLKEKQQILKNEPKLQALKMKGYNCKVNEEKVIKRQTQMGSGRIQTEKPTPKPILLSSKSSLSTINIQANESFRKKEQIQFEKLPNFSKPLHLKLNDLAKGSRFKTILTEDKGIQKAFTYKFDHQRMKKLGRLHPQEPFFEVPDISEITLFNPTINLNSSIFQFASMRSIQRNFTQSLDTNFRSKQQTSRSKLSNGFLDMSPRLREKSFQSESNKLSVRQKSKPSAKIIYLRNQSSGSIKKSNPQTPSSTKKMISIFSKKKSVQFIEKDSIQKSGNQKLVSCKSSIIKKSSHFSDIKPDKIHEKKKKTTEINSRQKFESRTDFNIGKSNKHNIDIDSQEVCIKEANNQSSQRNMTKSSKFFYKFLDLSAKRMGTMLNKKEKTVQKKETQSAIGLDKNSSRKCLNRDQSTKENKLSQFNTVSGKVISYREFIKQCPDQLQNSSGRKPLMQISENEPIFDQIKITEHEYSSKDLDVFYQSCSAQLPRETKQGGEAKCKRMRAKIEKMEMNTARKMKLEIQSMINQRKKTSIPILKY